MKNNVVVIGGLNLDICHNSKNELHFKESNIGNISFALGGVAYNIFKNLSKLNVKLKFISSVGDDFLSEWAINKLKKENICIDYIKINTNISMPIYSYVLNKDNDMLVAINDMKAIDKLDIDYINQYKDDLNNAKYIIIDTNISQDLIEYLCTNYPYKILVDGVSYIKVKKLKNVLKYIHSIKINRNELASLLDLKSIEDNQMLNCLKKVLAYGVQNIFVSDGPKGIYFNDAKNLQKVVNKPFEVVNASGAGDALASGIFYSLINNLSKYNQIVNGLILVKHTLFVNESTSNQISEDILKKGE